MYDNHKIVLNKFYLTFIAVRQENISKADQNCESDFTYIPLESIQKEKEQPMREKDITEKILERKSSRIGDLRNRKPKQYKKYMPFRIIGYDGAAYRSQLLDDRKEILPVMTGDERYQTIFQKEKGVHSMCDVAERLEKMGMEIGKNTGIHEEKIHVYKKFLEKVFSEQEAQEITELQESLGM